MTGGVITVLFIFIFAGAAYYFGKDVIERQNPNTIFNQDYQPQPDKF